MVLVKNFKFFPSFHLGKLGLKLFVGVGFSFKISVLAKEKIDIGNNLRNYWFNLLRTTNTFKCCFKTS